MGLYLPLTNTPLDNIIYIPDRLMSMFDIIFQHALTVVIAPSGSGKTVTVQEYLKRSTTTCINKYWYTAFGESLNKVWKRLCSVFAKIDNKTSDSLRALGSPVRENLSEIAELMQEICCDSPTVLVIDNYHLIQSDAPYELITALSQHGNDNLHIVVITQQLNDDLPVPLSAPYITKLDASHFLFNEKEVATYFKLYGFNLTVYEIKQAMDHTSGWISAIRLQVLHYQLTGELGKEPSIERLLFTTIWKPMSSADQMLLASLSLFSSINTKQIAIMLDTAKLSEHIVKLLSDLVFVSYDVHGQSCIVHNILQEFLQDRFNEYSKERKKLLYFRAGKAQLLVQEFFLALYFFSLSEDYDAVLSVPLRNNDLIGQNGNDIDAVLEKIFTECPKEKLSKYPDIFLVFALEQYVRGKKSSFEVCCKIIEEVLQIYENNDEINMKKIRGEYYFLYSYTAFNDISKMNKFQRLALADLGGQSDLFDFKHSFTPVSPSVLYQYWRDVGNLSNEIALLEKCMSDYFTLTGGHCMGSPTLMKAEAALYSGRLSIAETLCYKSIYLATTKQQDTVCLGADFILARIALLRGDAERYGTCLSELHDRMKTGKENALPIAYDLCRVWLMLCIGETKNLPSWIMKEKSILNYVYGQHASFAMLLYAKLLLITKEFNKLFGISELLLEKAESIPIQLAKVYYLIYLACAKAMIGSEEEAAKYLLKALSIALPDEIYLPFAEHGLWLESLLKKVKTKVSDAEGLHCIIDMCAKQKSGILKIKKNLNEVKNTLTLREFEIVQLAKQGKTNKEIAKALFISPETVKMALKNIFYKLNIHSRHELSYVIHL